jgi:CBS domain-containing protein
MFGGHFGEGLWIAFIGWFLDSAASSEVQQVVFKTLLAGHRVSQAMSPQGASVSADLTMQELVDKHILGSGQRCFLVTRGDRTIGLMTLHRLKDVPREAWSTTTAAQVMLPMEQLQRVDSQSGLWPALQKMDRKGVNQMPVTRDGHVIGMLSREDVISYLRTVHDLGI